MMVDDYEVLVDMVDMVTAVGGGRGERISVGNLKLLDSQSREPETSVLERGETSAISALVCA